MALFQLQTPDIINSQAMTSSGNECAEMPLTADFICDFLLLNDNLYCMNIKSLNLNGKNIIEIYYEKCLIMLDIQCHIYYMFYAIFFNQI